MTNAEYHTALQAWVWQNVSQEETVDEHLGTGPLDEGHEYELSNGESYLILTGSEAYRAARASVQSYIDDCLLDTLPEDVRPYFAADRFIDDVLLSDGLGLQLSSYDGEEHEITRTDSYGTVTFYIYRTA